MTEDKKQNQSQLMETSLIETIATIKNDEEQPNKFGNHQTITNANINIDLTELATGIMQETFKLVKQSIELAQQSGNQPMNYNNSDVNSTLYMGIYDQSSYGVYADEQKLINSQKYWNSESLRQKEFSSYDEALHFAKSGVASLKGINETAVPPMKISLNWRQKI